MASDKYYDSIGHCVDANSVQAGAVRKPERLIVEVTDDLASAVHEAYLFSKKVRAVFFCS